ncbi:unnamed protein product [Hermetia illucens]|uniref:LITAF domain-containing protein n=1 Tax=Hermetia illucens TaxID=343691 RepID=A0A7R8YLU6_HERIL|nr:lipopolysaccharide-induced tumor necrosis factor-alpha factor homolog isoform X2 [Hermetia illucens]CAD7076767.1 unnamed protein product [Hermetia illucens]
MSGYPYPPPGQPSVVIQTPLVVGPDPVRCICPSCGAHILTKMKYEPNTRTHVVALILCLFICWPCVCLPYCMDSCQNANHYCPNCDAFIGTYQS